jgi:L-alanine-DL-glutamate epimerase-like enolase superfamily enzyme
MDASDVVGIWAKIYKYQLGSHGMGAGTCLAMSGIDMALWDIRGKAAGWPLYKLLGGSRKPVPAYAGGVSLGYQEPKALVEEARVHVEAGYKAVKLRVGDSPKRDIARVAAIRKAFGDDLVILSDANTGYTVEDARQAMPGLEAHGVGWLEEPFPAHDHRSYQAAATFGSVPLAAGENHYTRFEFNRVIEDGIISILQPDLSKTGGITEALRIAALASAWKLPVHPHSSMTGLNMAASIHFLAAIENGGYFEGDVSKGNLFRDELVSKPYEVSPEGTVRPLEGPGLGLEVNEEFLAKHPGIDGPGYV